MQQYKTFQLKDYYQLIKRGRLYSVCACVLYIWEGDPVISEQRSEIVYKAQAT